MCQTNEFNRDTDSDGFLLVDLKEVDVYHSVCYGVKLKFFQNGCMVLALNVKIDNVNMGGVDSLAEVGHRNGKCHGYGCTLLVFSLTIEVARNDTLLAELF